ncbi:hypothetical protein B0A48_17032 [Cryoendolithus antarcticus]|uniref:Major facilitator superfamily (MFS) profile domain-containing protein n=1 Tax=Cryoendolithus antarcticus TaxID=1507870 RepID=A0A1V8SBT4_9PEZI|nr:hypothetical protein B0A48_17032 [Cryoendolithus antarcticus]
MYKSPSARSSDDNAPSAEAVPLQSLKRSSIDSLASSDLDQLLADDASDASSLDTPIDGGRQAWIVFFGCWIIEFMIWSLPLSYGVFQEYYSNHELFKSSTAIPTVGTLTAGTSNLCMPFMSMVAARWPQYRRTQMIAGWVLCVLALIGASFAKSIEVLLLCQGFLYGLGWVVHYTPVMFILNEWFDKQRGLVYGILFSASGVAGLVQPALLNWMLRMFDFKITFRVYAFAIICVSGPGLFLIRSRDMQRRPLVPTKALASLQPIVRSLQFQLIAFAVFVQGLGFFIPRIYINSYSSDLGLSQTIGAGLLALISLSQVCGQIGQGWVSDRLDVRISMSVSTLLCGLAALLLWGLAKTVWPLVSLALMWGLLSASYSVLYSRMCTFLVGKEDVHGDRDSVVMLMYGIFSFERGISGALAGPISSWLIGSSEQAIDVDAYGLGKYAGIVWFTGICMLVAATMGLGRLLPPKTNSK